MSMYVITHKHFNYQQLPTEYIPILVGADLNSNPDHFIADNTGDNISKKNPYYSELTGLYWIWKNRNDEGVGLSHYRRYFSKYSTYEKMFKAAIFTKLEPVDVSSMDQYLNNYDWIVTTPKTVGNISLMEQFNECHNAQDMKITRNIVKSLYPEYVNDFDKVMSDNKASFFNMFYTSREELDAYCKWLFDILFEVEKQTDVSNYDNYQQRLYGFLSERLFNVWLSHRKASIKYLAEYNTQEINKIYSLKQSAIYFVKKHPLLYTICRHFKKTKN